MSGILKCSLVEREKKKEEGEIYLFILLAQRSREDYRANQSLFCMGSI